MKLSALTARMFAAVTLLGAVGPAYAQTKEFDFWHIQTSENRKKIIQDAVDRYTKDNPGVKVNVQPVANDAYKTKIKVAMGAGDAPCVFISWGGGPLYEYVKSGQVVDLTPYMNKNNYKNRFLPASFSAVNFDDKIWGVPVESTDVAVVFYNKEVFEKYGLKPPKTYDELLKIVDTLKKNNVAAFSLANKTKWPGSMYYMYLVDRVGGPEVFKKAATRAPGGSFTDPAFIKAGEMLQDLVKRGAFVQGYNGLDYDSGQSRQLLYAGRAAMELMGTWSIGLIKKENPEFYEKNLGFFAFPAVKGGKGNPNNVIGTVGNNFYSISKSCKHPEEAFKMIQYLTDEKSVADRLADGRTPPLKGVKPTDPVLQRVIEMVNKAPSVQLWYDQYLPPEMGELHKDTSQGMFGLTTTPKDAAQRMEDLAKKSQP